jgi:hypothetical protein
MNLQKAYNEYKEVHLNQYWDKSIEDTIECAIPGLEDAIDLFFESSDPFRRVAFLKAYYDSIRTL